MASELVGTISFGLSLLPWLPLRPHLMGKGTWVRGLGCSGAFPAWGQSLVEGGSGELCGVGVLGSGHHGGQQC